jgi:hypothetical protein
MIDESPKGMAGKKIIFRKLICLTNNLDYEGEDFTEHLKSFVEDIVIPKPKYSVVYDDEPEQSIEVATEEKEEEKVELIECKDCGKEFKKKEGLKKRCKKCQKMKEQGKIWGFNSVLDAQEGNGKGEDVAENKKKENKSKKNNKKGSDQ